jgi:hypothetical protein
MQHILGKIWGEATCHDHRVEDEELRLPSCGRCRACLPTDLASLADVGGAASTAAMGGTTRTISGSCSGIPLSPTSLMPRSFGFFSPAPVQVLLASVGQVG